MKKILVSLCVFLLSFQTLALSEDALVKGIAQTMIQRAELYIVDIYFAKLAKNPKVIEYFPNTRAYFLQLESHPWISGKLLERAISQDLKALYKKVANDLENTVKNKAKKNLDSKTYQFLDELENAFNQSQAGNFEAKLKAEEWYLKHYPNAKGVAIAAKALLKAQEMNLKEFFEKEKDILKNCVPAAKDDLQAYIFYKFCQVTKEMRDIELDPKKGNYVLLFNDISDLLESIYFDKNNVAIFNRFKRYAIILGQLADADQAEEVSAIMSQIVAGSNSYQEKEQDKFSIYINTYLGATAYRSNDENLEQKVYGGIFAPFGLEFSMGTSSKRTYSLLATIFDFGNVVNAEINGNSQNFNFYKAISPGAYFVYGFKHSPLTMGIGYQRAARTSGNYISGQDNNTNGRVGVFFAFDIPFFKLY